MLASGATHQARADEKPGSAQAARDREVAAILAQFRQQAEQAAARWAESDRQLATLLDKTAKAQNPDEKARYEEQLEKLLAERRRVRTAEREAKEKAAATIRKIAAPAPGTRKPVKCDPATDPLCGQGL